MMSRKLSLAIASIAFLASCSSQRIVAGDNGTANPAAVSTAAQAPDNNASSTTSTAPVVELNTTGNMQAQPVQGAVK